MNAFRWDLRMRWGVFVGASVLFLYLLGKHTPWRDEYQAWLVATQTLSWTEFFDAVRLERNPPLSYLLLRAIHEIGTWILGRAPDPLWTLRLHSAPFALGSFFLLTVGLKGASFQKRATLWIPFGIFFLREYGLLARSYAMGCFFLLLALQCLRLPSHRRTQQPALMWLAVSCVIGAAHTQLLFGLLCLSFLWMRLPWTRTARMVTAVGVFASFVLQIPPESTQYSQGFSWARFTWTALVSGPAQGLSGLERLGLGIYEWNHNSFRFFSGLLFMVAFYFGAGRRLFLRWLWTVFPVFCVLQWGYAGSLRHQGFYFLALLIAVAREQDPRLSRASLMFVLSMTQMASTGMWLRAWGPFESPPHADFSGSAEAVQFLQKTPTAWTIVTDDDMFAYGVMAQGGYRVFDIRRNAYVRYPRFDKSEWKWNLQTWCKQFGRAFFKSTAPMVWLMHNGGTPPPDCSQRKTQPHLLFTNTRTVLTDETLSIFTP